MRIALVSLDYWPWRSSGLAIYAEDLARGLHERGHTITVLAARRPGTAAVAQQAGITVRRVPIDQSDWIGYSARAARHLVTLEREAPFEIVHFLDLHFAYAYPGPFVASLWQSFRQRLTADGGRPYASSWRNYLVRSSYYRLARHWIEPHCLRRAGQLITACDSTTHEFIQHYGVAPERIGRAVQGTDLAALQPQAVNALRERLGLEGRQVLLFVGFATARKGLEHLALAMRQLPTEVVWLIVGRWEAGYRARVLAALGPARDRVREIGPISDAERASYYALADIYVSPSLLEGFGLTPIEAQACGTPAIVTASSSGYEEVGPYGLVVPARDPAALARAIRVLLANPALRANLGARAQARVHAQFSYQAMAAQTEALYHAFMARSSATQTASCSTKLIPG
ncbi:MAG: glycosyltransferase family 4 protein [Oscillochloridaceae bacterium umkhey_bin13]